MGIMILNYILFAFLLIGCLNMVWMNWKMQKKTKEFYNHLETFNQLMTKNKQIYKKMTGKDFKIEDCDIDTLQ